MSTVSTTPAAPFADQRFRPLVDAFKALYRRRRDGGGALAIYRHGRPLVDVWAGYADVERGTPWRGETMAMSYSTSKGVASTVVHRLVERGVLAYDEPVATWWPEFAANGKSDILLRDVLTHRAGLSKIRGVMDTPGDLLDHHRVAAKLAERPPNPSLRGKPAYHALTFGWLVAAVVERATGQPFAEVLRAEVADPLSLDGLHIGTPAGEHHRVATLFPLGFPLGISSKALGQLKRIQRFRAAIDALIPVGFEGLTNTPALLAATMPAANGVFTARSLARMYAALANDGAVDGVTFLQPSTVRTTAEVQTKATDRVLGFRMLWRLGYHRGFVAQGPQPRHTFGHFGYGGSGAWADPGTGLSIAFTTNRLGSMTTPVADARLARLGQLALECARA